MESTSNASRSRPAFRRRAILMAVAAGLAWTGLAETYGQDLVRDFSNQPILVLNTGGHSAPVRNLAFSQDETKLLSAGEDKVVRVWDLLSDPPSLHRTIRPPIWRGSAGAIYGMALSTPDARGQQTLALSGNGVQSTRGDIRLFRYPGAVDRPQGDPDGFLPGGEPEQGRAGPPIGHLNVVGCLAFHPGGPLLASGSNDGTIRLWDTNRKVTAAILSAPGQGQVISLAFAPGGTKLVSGGSDGTLRVWDITRQPPAVTAAAAPIATRRNEADGLQINTLGVSPDGRWVVIGREDGLLLRYDLLAANLAASAALLPRQESQGPVEALAFSPDGRLATSIVHLGLPSPDARPTVECDIEIRRMPDGAVTEVRVTESNLVHALAFSPKGRYFAYAGGDRQSVVVRDLGDPRAPLITLAGQGSSIWDVGFAQNAPADDGGLSVAFSYDHPGLRPPDEYRGFNTRSRTHTTLNRDQVRRALTEYEGWAVRPVNPRALDVLRNGQPAFPINLTNADLRWWSHTFIPPGPGHAKPCVAVACHRGVVIYRLEDHVRTRFLDGHSGSVYCVAPSRDGRWLATGSSDQTVRLWTLADCDVAAPLGAEFREENGRLVVTKVEKHGFAESGSLQVGDEAVAFGLKGDVVKPGEFLRNYSAVPPNSTVQLKLRSRGETDTREKEKQANGEDLVLFGTTKRDRPAMSLFVGLDQEWVAWMPRGYYDSSVTGDSTLLGWQVNRSTAFVAASTDYYKIRTYEKELRQPRHFPNNYLDQLLNSGQEAVVLGDQPRDQAPQLVVQQPPRITALAGGGGIAIQGADGKAIAPGGPLTDAIRINQGQLGIDWAIESPGSRPLAAFEVRLDGQSLGAARAPALDPAKATATVPSRVDLEPGTYRITALARNDQGIERTSYMTVEVVGPPKPRPLQLTVLTLAPAYDDPKIPAIELNDADERDLPPFFSRHLAAPNGGTFKTDAELGCRLVGREATGPRYLSALDMLSQSKVERGDMLVLLIEAHVLRFGPESRIVVADSQGAPPSKTLPAETVSQALGSLVRRGCKVFVVLDGVHDGPRASKWDSDVVEWVRALRNEHDVITLVASTRRQSQPYRPGGHRVLAQSILAAVNTARARPRADGPATISLADFRKAVLDSSLQLTQRRSDAACYIPEGISGGVPFLLSRPVMKADDRRTNGDKDREIITGAQ